MTISGGAKLAGVMGWPVAHSRSPLLHNTWLARYGIDGAYVPLAVAPEDFEAAFRALPKLGFRGCNVTVPHKESAFRLCDRLDASATAIGAANTVVIEDGALVGHNTDGYGFIENLRQSAHGFAVDTAIAVVLGAGGSARAVVRALLDAGVPELRLVNRSQERAEALVRDVAGADAGRVTVLTWMQRTAALEGAGLLVNTTTLGMKGQGEIEIDLGVLTPHAVVADLVYVPLETRLLRNAASRSLKTVGGLGMLIHQARPGFYAWFGIDPRADADIYKLLAEDVRTREGMR